jgi:hypothetical protein
MDEKISKIDEIVKRTGCTYEEAKIALEASDDDLLEALIIIEKGKSKEERLKNKSEDIVEEIKKIVKEANATKLVIIKDDETLINIPISAGAVGVVLSPLLGVAGITVAMLAKCTVEIYTKEGNKININDKIDKSIEKIKDEIDNIGKK